MLKAGPIYTKLCFNKYIEGFERNDRRIVTRRDVARYAMVSTFNAKIIIGGNQLGFCFKISVEAKRDV